MVERLEEVQRAFTAYTIERELGGGGMATVYLAHDKKHDRQVAIKVLHAELAAELGAERFLREIRVTAYLQHPHILGLIDSGVLGGDAGELKGRPYYVMPFVEGESLRQRLEKEQQLPVPDAVRIATEVASALDYAHRHNVIHRDIKPENILLHDGSAIVADFGIALAVTQAGGARITQTGLSLGTPAYMSPEQAMGERAITARSDIYSLGAVTYEMLSGEPPFSGPTVQAVVARVMTEEPRPLTTQRRNLPANVAAAVSRALEKIPADRFASAHAFAEALKNPSFATSATPTAVPSARDGTPFRWLFYAAALVAVLFIGIAAWTRTRRPPSKQVLRYTLVFDSTQALSPLSGWRRRVAISPDGSHLAYVGGPGGGLLVRSRNQLHATPISGSDHAVTPFFSPDSKNVGFKDDKGLRIASLDGRPAITVSDSSVLGLSGATWGPDGFIYVDANGETLGGGLLRIEAKAGARPAAFTTLDRARGESDHLWPRIIPSGKAVLITVAFSVKKAAERGSMFSIAVAEIPSGKHRTLINDGMNAVYATSGHLLYVNTKKTLMMVRFDQNSLKISGEPTALVEGLRTESYGSTDLDVSETGTLVYATGSGRSINDLVWVTRTGKAEPVDPDWRGQFTNPALSPNGKQLAVTITNPDGTTDVWVKQLDRGPSIKLTVEGGNNIHPSWMPDGRSVSFSSDAAGLPRVFTRRADASTPAVPQLQEKRQLYSPVWSNDGKWLLCSTGFDTPGAGDILGFRPGVDIAAVPLIASRFRESAPALSPDGRWLAYTSWETGRAEVYVVPFPNTKAGKWALSTQGGRDPQWSHSGKEVFFTDGASNLVSTEVKTTPGFSVGRSTTLFPTPAFWSDFTPAHAQYSIAPDDRRFLLVQSASGTQPDKLTVVENWFEELDGTARK